VRKLAVVVHEGDKWLVKTEDESRTLGTHDTAKDAYAQLYAIEKSKEREKKKASFGSRYEQDKLFCSCDPEPATPEAHNRKAIELTQDIYRDGREPAPEENGHIDHHFRAGAGLAE
jgi:hypothetical protein